MNVTVTEDPFVAHRGLLFTVAYEMLGSAADAEDVVQETWLRWDAIGEDARAEVRDPRAFLVRMVTRKALDRLRSNARRREEYVGEWLPEPLLTAPDVADDVELAESVSIAMLTVLETLTPTERAVFVLREVFDTPYDEIAEVVGKSAAAVRQIGHRAREHVAARRPRMEVSRGEQQEVVERFLAAVTQGDLQGLLDVLAPDVVLVADGGGVVQAVVNPVIGAKKVANLLRPFNRLAPEAEILPVLLNGAVGARIVGTDDGYDTAISFVVEEGRISRIYAVRNPAKLGGSTSRRRSAVSALVCRVRRFGHVRVVERADGSMHRWVPAWARPPATVLPVRLRRPALSAVGMHGRAVPHDASRRRPGLHVIGVWRRDLGQQVNQGRPLGPGQWLQHRFLSLTEHVVKAFERGTPRLGQGHDVAASISGVGGTSSEPAAGEVVERGNDVTAVDSGVAAEVGLTARAVFLEGCQHSEVVAAHALCLERLTEDAVRPRVGA